MSDQPIMEMFEQIEEEHKRSFDTLARIKNLCKLTVTKFYGPKLSGTVQMQPIQKWPEDLETMTKQ